MTYTLTSFSIIPKKIIVIQAINSLPLMEPDVSCVLEPLITLYIIAKRFYGHKCFSCYGCVENVN
jgi:hypothetical protein